MSQREATLLWLKDLLEHLLASQQQLEWTEEPGTIHVLTEVMLRDLESCRRLCEAVQQRSRPQPVL
jgi:hypothetical protein